MVPNKIGQIAKFHTPLPEDNLNQLYVVLQIIQNEEKPMAEIKALNADHSLAPIKSVNLEDLELVEVGIDDLVGFNVTINKADYSQATGKVVNVSEQKILLDLTNGVKGVETNVWLTIEDENGKVHTGTFFVN